MTSMREINDILLKVYAHDFKRYQSIFAQFFDDFKNVNVCEHCGLEEEHPVHHQTSSEGTNNVQQPTTKERNTQHE